MSKRKLLLADDSVTIQKVVNLTFADEGIEVITVGDGDAALQKISETGPDVVLADVHMPGLNGYQVCELVRKNPATSSLPVVLLVGSFEPFDENEAQRVGANAYMTKPFQSIRQLVSQVSDLMRGTAEEEPQIADEESPTITDEQVTAEYAPATAEDELSLEPEIAETSDIDSLYHQSLAEPAVDGGETVPPQYVDAGMDDEMIETIPASEFEGHVSEPDMIEEDEQDFAIPPQHIVASPFDSPATADAGSAAVATARDDSTAAYDQFARTEPMSAAFEAATTEENFDLNEMDILELPGIETGKTIEFKTAESAAAEGGRQVVSLSPELMEMLVEKVVQRLSEKD